MIALIGLLPPPMNGRGCVVLDGLPGPDNVLHDGYLAACVDVGSVEAVLSWYERVMEVRPSIPLGLCVATDSCLRPLARSRQRVDPILGPDDLVAGGISVNALQRLRERSVEGRILEQLVTDAGKQVLDQEATVKAVIAHAVSGGTLKSAARDLGIHVQTVGDRLNAVGLHAVRTKSFIRIEAYDLRIRLGADRQEALLAGGWSDPEARRKCVARLKRWRALGDSGISGGYCI